MKMMLLLNLLIFLSILSVVLSNATPDNFLLTFDRDLRSFGVRKRRSKSMPFTNTNKKSFGTNKKMNEVKVVSNTDDFDRAEQTFFDIVENTERAVLKTAESLIHDEVNVLFGKDHGHSLHLPMINPKKQNSTTKKKNEKAMEKVSIQTEKRQKANDTGRD
mmetsp:Transcript_17331/g.21179  ORF Transcript_17331/g.21179 Transcript_17331/m.21179 type:complete len:161 (+) Transcript_17331:132-614(+)